MVSGKRKKYYSSARASSLSGKPPELPSKIVIGVPFHRLSDELEGRLEKLGVRAVVWRGRDNKLADGTPTVCKNSAAVNLAMSVSANIEKQVCADKDNKCVFYDECEYQKRKREAKNADVVIVAHEILRYTLPAEITKNLAMIILEEGFLGKPGTSIIKAATLLSDISKIENQPCFEYKKTSGVRFPWPDYTATDELMKLRHRFPVDFRGYLTRDSMSALTVEMCHSGAALEWKRKREPEFHPGMSLREMEGVAKNCALNAQVHKLAALWECAADLLDGDNASTGRIELVIDSQADGDCPMFRINRLNKLHDDCLKHPILCLDRTADIDIVRRYLPRIEALASGTPITRHAVINQLPSSKFSLTNMQKSPDLVDEIVDFVWLCPVVRIRLLSLMMPSSQSSRDIRISRQCTSALQPGGTGRRTSDICLSLDNRTPILRKPVG